MIGLTSKRSEFYNSVSAPVFGEYPVKVNLFCKDQYFTTADCKIA